MKIFNLFRFTTLTDVPLLTGSDALLPGVFPSFGLHDELESLVRAGLTPAEAMRVATLEPARRQSP